MGWVASVARRGQARALRVAGRTCGVYRGTKSTRLVSNSPFSAYEQLARDCAASGGAPAAKAAAAAAWAAYKDTFPEGAAAPAAAAKRRAAPLSPTRRRSLAVAKGFAKAREGVLRLVGRTEQGQTRHQWPGW